MRVMVIDLCGDEKWEDTLEGARGFLSSMWQNMDIDEDEEEEFDLDEHLEEIAEADFDRLDEMLQGVGYCIDKIESVHENDIKLYRGI